MVDPGGEEAVTLGAVYAYWKFEQASIRPINQLLAIGVTYADEHAGILSEQETEEQLDHQLANHTFEKMAFKTFLESQGMPGAGFIAGQAYDKEKSSLQSTVGNNIPGSQTMQAPFNVGRILGSIGIGTAQRAFAWAMGDPTPTNGGTVANSTAATTLSSSITGAFTSSGGGGRSTPSTSTSGGSLSSSAAAAGSYAKSLNSFQSSTAMTTPAVIKSTASSSSSGGGSIVQRVTTSISDTVSSITKSVVSTVKSAWSRVTSFFGGKK